MQNKWIWLVFFLCLLTNVFAVEELTADSKVAGSKDYSDLLGDDYTQLDLESMDEEEKEDALKTMQDMRREEEEGLPDGPPKSNSSDANRAHSAITEAVVTLIQYPFETLAHPIEHLEMIGEIIKHPIEFIKRLVKQIINSFKNDSLYAGLYE